MKRLEFDNLLLKFQNGDGKLLEIVYRQYKSSCEEKLKVRLKCGPEKARDLYMDSILIFRREALKGRVSFINLEGYLYTVAFRIFLRDQAQQKILREKVNNEIPEVIVGEDADKIREEALAEAWSEMGLKCRNLLKDYYYNGHKLKDLQNTYGYSSYESIKTTKKRCFAKLKSLVRDHYERLTKTSKQ